MTDFKELFSTFKGQDRVILLDPSLPINIYYGLDNMNRYCVGIKTDFPVGTIDSTKLLSISLGKGVDSWWTTISLTDLSAVEPFYAFCDDIISVAATMPDQETAYKAIANRILSWRKMFGAVRSTLSEEAIRGLFGELSYLKKVMFPKYGIEGGEAAWSGPLGTDKDFSIGKEWFEIKSVSVNASSVKITSIEQLASDDPGHLVLMRTERMAEGYDDGLSDLNQLFKKISNDLDAFPSSQKSFFEKLDRLGFTPNEAYSNFKFKIDAIDSYFVDEKFPRLSRSVLDNKAILKASYELSVNALEEFKEKKDV